MGLCVNCWDKTSDKGFVNSKVLHSQRKRRAKKLNAGQDSSLQGNTRR